MSSPSSESVTDRSGTSLLPVVGNTHLVDWVDEMARLTQPDRVVWCDGSEAERRRLVQEAVASGVLVPLDAARRPGSYLHRSDPDDVARVEHLTFICTRRREDAGPTNHWMDPAEAYGRLRALFRGAMRGRTMYVVPYLMGPAGSPWAKVGLELTDSIYVVLSMRAMTRMGRVALEALGTSPHFNRGLHSTLDLDPAKRFICHFPEDDTIWSVGSGYGGNALLGKKCLALRIASYQGRREGWLAEHMALLEVERPDGEVTWVAGAFPSQCGKTNFAMMVPPARFHGWKVRTIGDDIAWMHVGADGRLWAINPEAGYFGVAPGTSPRTNPSAMAMVSRDALFTNVALTPDGDVWWEGIGHDPPPGLVDWQGRPWTPASGRPAAHPNARFTTPMARNPVLSSHVDDPRGVPISAILFGGRRRTTVPLVVEARDWARGVYLGATMGSETTAAATGRVGVVRRDPMAMLPFCGYDMGEYFAHWLSLRARLTDPPRIYQVNWFRQGAGGGWLWPGYGENLRVLQWIVDRAHGRAGAIATPLGDVPAPADLDLAGLDLPASQVAEALAIHPDEWLAEIDQQEELFRQLARTMPAALVRERQALRASFEAAARIR